MMRGKVYLVGAGPGEPGLLTLRGRECLAEADVVLYDDLVDRRTLRFARPEAERVAMGKRGDASQRDCQQAAIDERMIREARAGRTVARLKGGDPFVFGRGGEECDTLAAAGIPFEVVPGVTSAVAVPAYAGIPLTHRGRNSSFTVVTGHEAPGAEGHLDWDALARMETLVFLMALKRLEDVAARLVAAGKRGDTPAACIRSGTRPDQAVVVAALTDLAGEVRRAGFEPPAVVVVGEVVRLRERLRWFEARPLLGRRILVTRAAGQADALRDGLERLGAETIAAATIEIVPADSAPLDRTLETLSGFDWVVFTSRNAVRIFFDRLFARGADARALGGVRVAAVGPATAAGLRERGIRPDVVPEDFRAEGLRDRLLAAVSGKRVLLPRAAGARDVLPRAFRETGAEVVDVAIYRSVPVATLPEPALCALREGRLDAVTFTSSSAVTSFVERIRAEGLEIGGTKVACIGPVTASTARALGLRVDVEAAESTVEGLVAVLVDSFVERR